MKKAFNWIVNHFPTRRRIIQFYTFLLYNANLKGYIHGTIFTGNSKYMCVPGMNCYSCPGAVAACPLGALQNALTASKTTTAYYVFGIIALFGLILGRMICGFFCPIGLGQELLYKIKTPKIRKSKYTRVLSYLKYFILVVFVVAIPLMFSLAGATAPGFCKFICPAGTFEGGLGLLLNPVNQSGSRSLLDMLGPIFTWKFIVLCVIIIASVLLYRPFCRFICPLGAIYGFFNNIALIGVKLDENKCTDCGLCIAHCKMDVKHVGDHECINCGECISVCPAKAITWKGAKIFLRKNDVETPVAAEKKPLSEMRNMHYTAPSSPVPATATAGANGQSGDLNNQQTSSAVRLTVVEKGYTDVTPSSEPSSRFRRDKTFWIRFSAWVAAFIVLLTALIYFNLQPEPELSALNVGDTAPNFSLKMYGKNERGRYALLDENFVMEDHLGEVVVVNFWATWCGPCVKELPGFAEVAEECNVTIVAIHGRIEINQEPQIWIPANHREWIDSKLIFLQDEMDGSTAKTFVAYGGVNSYPITVIVGKDGKVTYTMQGELKKDILKREVEKAQNA